MKTKLPRSQGAILLYQHFQSQGRGGMANFARAVGLHYATVDLWLRGKTMPRPPMWHRIEQVTGGHVRAMSWLEPGDPGVAPEATTPGAT